LDCKKSDMSAFTTPRRDDTSCDVKGTIRTYRNMKQMDNCETATNKPVEISLSLIRDRQNDILK